MNMVLIGAKASGKTTICSLLSKKLGKKLVCAEDEIMKRARMSIPSIIKKGGMDSFFEIECEIIEKISGFDDCVFDTMPSIVIRNENITSLKKNSLVIFLTSDMKTIANRLRAKKSGFGKDYTVALHAQECESRYRNAADYAIDTSRLSPEEVCDLITHYIQTELQ